MYNSYEEPMLKKRSTTVLDDDRQVINAEAGSSTATKPSIGFTTVRKNPNRLTVTNTGKQETEVTSVAKPKAKSKAKNIAMTCVFSIVAIALSAVIALNAITLGSLSATNAQLATELTALETSYSALSTELTAVSSAERITELAASQLELTATTAATTASFTVPGYVAVEAQTFDNNWFDNVLDLLAG